MGRRVTVRPAACTSTRQGSGEASQAARASSTEGRGVIPPADTGVLRTPWMRASPPEVEAMRNVTSSSETTGTVLRRSPGSQNAGGEPPYCSSAIAVATMPVRQVTARTKQAMTPRFAAAQAGTDPTTSRPAMLTAWRTVAPTTCRRLLPWPGRSATAHQPRQPGRSWAAARSSQR